MPNEPRIYAKKPVWANLEEISRDSRNVKFRTFGGYITAPVEKVDAYREETS